MLFALYFEGQVKEWYLSLPPGSIGDPNQFEDDFMRRWSSDAQGSFNIEKFYHKLKQGKTLKNLYKN